MNYLQFNCHIKYHGILIHNVKAKVTVHPGVRSEMSLQNSKRTIYCTFYLNNDKSHMNHGIFCQGNVLIILEGKMFLSIFIIHLSRFEILCLKLCTQDYI